ncbi:hypothetical protein SCAR479_05137 [Seiridium cardinale]|uniref:Uncharacterized protein n=1 Tax=Seiridium cardinale TaxID=138064 RepID=A0ABR2XWM2_9PEZI
MPADGRSVRFGDEDRSRTSPRSRDSGFGSSTEQAHVGGRSDRIFTAQDYEDQRYNVRALQEALDSSNDDVGRYKKKVGDLDQELSSSRKIVREQETKMRGLITANETLKDTHKGLLKEIESLKDENFDLRQRLTTYSPSDPEYMMSGGSGESSDGVRRSRSKRHGKNDSQELKDRMKERINKGNQEAEASASKSTHKDSEKKRERRQSVSKATRKPYIEEPPNTDRRERRGPPVTTRGFDHLNYTTSPPASSPARVDHAASSPRSSGPSSYASYAPSSGDYYPAPLPPKNSSTRKHRQN